MLKPSVLLAFVFCMIQNSWSQEIETIYLDKEYKEVSKKEAAYYRTIQAHPDGTDKVFVQTFYISGKPKSNESCQTSLCIQKEGYYVSFYENGNKEQEGERENGLMIGVWSNWYENGQMSELSTYSNGMKLGIWKTWYENGQPEQEAETIGDWNTPLQRRNKIINYWEPSGNQLIVDGTGEMIEYHEDTAVVSSTGAYKNGFKIGIWKGFNEDGKLFYEETYKKDKVSGISWDSLGNSYKYVEIQEQPSPKGGMQGLYSYVGKNVKYPNEARRNGVQGRVYVQFVVDKNGKLTEIKTLKGIGSGCDYEAEQVLENSPRWLPGKQRGQLVKVRMVLPITFRLS